MTPSSPGPRLRYPTSGQLVGMAATFLRLKGLLREEDVGSPSYRTAQRYFDGNPSVTPGIVDDIIDRLLLEFLPLEAVPPEIRPQDGPPLDWLQSTVKEALHRWDALVGGMNGETYPLTERRYAAVPFLRLFTLDLAVRWAAHQAARSDPNQEADAEPFWLRPDALRVVTDHFRRGATATLSMERLEGETGVSLNTLESWRRGDSFPERAERVASLVKVLAKHSGESRRLVDFRVRVAAGAAAVIRELHALCGEERIEDLIATFSKVVRLAYRIFRFGPIPGEAWATEMRAFVLRGAHARLGPVVCEKLAEYSALHQEVAADLLALPGDWAPRLNYWAKRVSELGRFPAEEVRRSGIDPGVAKMVFEGLPTILLTMRNFDQRPEDVRLLTVPADDAMKAHARSAQAAMAASLGNLHEAIEHARRAVDLQPDNADYRYAIGAYLGQLAPGAPSVILEEALVHFRRAHALRPIWNRPSTEIGIILSNAGRFEEAEEQFAASEEIAGDWDHFHYARGMNYLGLGRYDAAAAAFRRTLDLEVDHRSAMVRLGAALAMRGHLAELPRLAKEVRHRGGPEIGTASDWQRYSDPAVSTE
jgi:tetratricopeptide (TPR) repeat protein